MKKIWVIMMLLMGIGIAEASLIADDSSYFTGDVIFNESNQNISFTKNNHSFDGKTHYYQNNERMIFKENEIIDLGVFSSIGSGIEINSGNAKFFLVEVDVEDPLSQPALSNGTYLVMMPPNNSADFNYLIVKNDTPVMGIGTNGFTLGSPNISPFIGQRGKGITIFGDNNTGFSYRIDSNANYKNIIGDYRMDYTPEFQIMRGTNSSGVYYDFRVVNQTTYTYNLTSFGQIFAHGNIISLNSIFSAGNSYCLDNMYITNNLQVNGGSIGLSTDPDLFKMRNNVVDILGSLNVTSNISINNTFGISGNVSTGSCWQRFASGLLLATNCTVT